MLIKKDFVLSDSTLNTYGFRLLTSGYQIQEFQKNPIGYYMHLRDNGVLLKWVGIRIDGDKIIAQPDINMSNARGQQTVDEINNNFLNAASVGHIVVLESSDDPALKMQGQTGPTITKWYNRECSLVDIPANNDALVLYDANDNVINLSQLSAKQAITYNFSANALPPTAIPSVDEMLKEAVKNKDITGEVAVNLKKKYQNDASALHSLLPDFAKQRLKYLNSLSWDELDKGELLEELKNRSYPAYRLKFYSQFGVEPGSNDKKNVAKNDIDTQIENLETMIINDEKGNQSTLDFVRASVGNDPQKHLQRLKHILGNGANPYDGKTWDELDKDNKLEALKKDHYDTFKKLYRDKFGVEYKEPAR